MLSQVTREELKSALQGPRPPTVIDVREPDEFAQGHIRGAELIPLSSLPREIKRRHPNKAESVVVYDDLGVRSSDAARLLRAMGYENVRELLGSN